MPLPITIDRARGTCDRNLCGLVAHDTEFGPRTQSEKPLPKPPGDRWIVLLQARIEFAIRLAGRLTEPGNDRSVDLGLSPSGGFIQSCRAGGGEMCDCI